MGVAWRSATNGNIVTVPSTGVTVTKPSGVVTGDVLYAFVCKTDTNTAAWTCSGWTAIFGNPFTGTTNVRHIGVLRKVITNAGGEPSSYTFVTTSGSAASMCGIIVCVSGADTATPEDVTFTTAQRVLAQNDATPPSIDLVTNSHNTLVMQYCALALGSTATKTWGAPSGYTQDANAIAVETGSASNDLQCGVAYKMQATAGSVGTNDWTHTTDDATTDYATAVLAVRPKADEASGGLLAASRSAVARMIR